MGSGSTAFGKWPIMAVAVCVFVASSCAQPRPGDLRFLGADGREGSLTFLSGPEGAVRPKAGNVASGSRYAFPETPALRGQSGLIIEYEAKGLTGGRVEFLVSRKGRAGSGETVSWELALSPSPVSFHLPLEEGDLPLGLEFGFEPAEGELRVSGVRIDPRGAFRGFELIEGRIALSPGCSLRPSAGGGKALSLPLENPLPGLYGITIETVAGSGVKARLGFGGTALTVPSSSSGKPVAVPVFLGESAELVLEMPSAFQLRRFMVSPIGDGPIMADPGIIIDWDRRRFRGGGYETFRWDAFPEILILLFADYGEQDLALKRLAFYAEKAGFRGRLAEDGEIAALHGWNAHDYPASTLASYFSLAEAEKFPLGVRELELRSLLEGEGVIRKDAAGWAAGKGALLSISLESSRAMRERFMAHEGIHGIYFLDAEFRKRVKGIWEGVERETREYILEFFDFKEFDVGDAELMANEFAAYFLQTPLSQTPSYFTDTVAGFLEADRDGGGRYRRFAKEREELFAGLAGELDRILRELYGLESGRVWRTGKP